MSIATIYGESNRNVLDTLGSIMEKEMATHSSVLAWRIPGTAEPGGLPSVGSQRVGHDWSDLVVVAVVGPIIQKKKKEKAGISVDVCGRLGLYYHLLYD